MYMITQARIQVTKIVTWFRLESDTSHTSLIIWVYNSSFSYFQTLFLAYGPVFKKNLAIEPFQNVELFNLMCGKYNKW